MKNKVTLLLYKHAYKYSRSEDFKQRYNNSVTLVKVVYYLGRLKCIF